MCATKHRCVGVISKLGNPNPLQVGMSGEFSVNSCHLFPLEGARVKFWIATDLNDYNALTLFYPL